MRQSYPQYVIYDLTAAPSVFEFTLNDHGEALQDFLAAISIFAATEEEADKISKKGRVSSKGLGENLRLLRLAYEILRQRLGEYPHDFEVSSLTKFMHLPTDRGNRWMLTAYHRARTVQADCAVQ